MNFSQGIFARSYEFENVFKSLPAELLNAEGHDTCIFFFTCTSRENSRISRNLRINCKKKRTSAVKRIVNIISHEMSVSVTLPYTFVNLQSE